MKTKYLGVVAACALAPTVGTANATTYDINSGDLLLTSAYCSVGSVYQAECNNALNNLAYGSSEGPLTGTVTIDNGILTGVDLELRHLLFTVATSFSFTSQDQWSLKVYEVFGLLQSDENVGLFVRDTFNDDNTHSPFLVYNNSPITAPLPGSALLFLTGLAALGTLGWRRKKKALAA